MISTNEIGKIAASRIEEVLTHLGFDYTVYPDRIAMPCPIHGGDNEEGLCIYTTGHSMTGNWVCWTHNCEAQVLSDTVGGKKVERERGKNVFGLIRGLLASQYDRHVEYAEAIEWAKKFLSIEDSDVEVDSEELEETRFVNRMRFFISPLKKKNLGRIERAKVIKSLKIPAEYYLERGYLPETLEKYDVGLCLAPGKEMNNRVVVPVYDLDHKYMIGCLGRTTKPKCILCSLYHSDEELCPSTKFERLCARKWKNGSGFNSGLCLYNSWYAKQEIARTKRAYIVEGPGDVWRMDEAGYSNTLGLFGAKLTDEQIMLLNRLGVMELVLLTDNDEAGIAAREKIIDKCEYLFKTSFLDLPSKDIGDMSVEEIRRLI